MKAVYTVLFKTLVAQFYRKNAGFFFVLLALAAGVMRDQEHYYLMMAALHSYALLGYMTLLWSLYLLKTLSFTFQSLAEKPNQFLYELRLYPAQQRVAGLAVVHGLQFLPVILYAGIMITLGLIHQRWAHVLLCILFLLLAMAVAVSVCDRRLHFPGKENWLLRLTTAMSGRFRKPRFSLFLFKIVHSHKVLFLLTKLTTCFLIILAAKLYRMGGYDERLPGVVLAVVGLAEVVLVYYFHHFENVSLSFQKNLPFSLPARLLSFTLTLALLLLPEAAVLVRHCYAFFSPLWLLSGIGFMLSIALLLYSCLYIKALVIEIFIRRVFFGWLIYFLAVMFGVPLWAMMVLNVVVAFFIFIQYHDRFEYSL